MIEVHQAFTGPQYECPGLSVYERAAGWSIRSASWKQRPGGYWPGDLGFTDAGSERARAAAPLVLGRWVPGLGWAEAAVWDDDLPERIARRVDKRRGFCRSHVLVWPTREAADRYRSRVPFVDPATVGEGDLRAELLSIMVEED